MNKVLVFAVHPDDETLGCGGTLLKHKANGDLIYWAILTTMNIEHGAEKQWVRERSQEIETIAAMYGFDGIERAGFPALRLDTLPLKHLVSEITKIIQSFQPNILYLPYKGDVHSDHRIAFQAVYSCSKSFHYPFIRKMLMMEVLSETEFAPATKEDTFVPNVFVDITPFIKRKTEIMCCYKSEIGEHPFPRSVRNIEALATLRGATAGCKYAEAFMLLKEIG